MRQRTCSHRIPELYNEIILSSEFTDEYIARESFHLSNIYVTIFKNKGYKAKLLIIDKENQNIIFENIYDNTFLIYNSIQEDAYLYSIDTQYSLIYKFNNPILNNGIVIYSLNEKHPFISLSKNINDILLKDDLLYFSINISSIRVENDKKICIDLTKEKNYLTTIDKIAEDFVFQEITALIGINSNGLIEIDRGVFNGDTNPIKFLEKKINRKNSLIIEVFDGYYMEYFSHLIDYSLGINKRLHPKNYIEIGNKYLLVLPEYYDYNVYSDFKLIRLCDLEEFDFCRIFNIENQLNPNKYSLGEFDLINLQFLSDDLLTIGDHEFSCENLFSLTSKIKNNLETQEIKLKTLIPIKNNDISGFALDIHTIKSTLLDDGKFETTRTDLGDLLFRLKYKFDRSTIEEIAVKCSKVIQSAYSDIDVIIPAPPSNLERPFQPVFEVAKRIGELTKIPIDLNYVIKLPTEQIKSLNNQEDRNIVLDRSISIIDDRYKNKNVLIFDDLYRSGDTLSAISKRLLNQGKVNTVKVLCITKTRTKR
jgi:competence protein ComFC